MWALEYCTTPSSSFSTGPSPSTAMIEWALMAGATGISCRARMKRWRGDMLSTADGITNGPLIASGFRAMSAVSPVRPKGSVTSHRTRLRTT
jgi:hypothetical protein